MLNIDEAAIRESVAKKVADDLVNDDQLINTVKRELDGRIANIFATRVDKIIADAVDAAVMNGFEREYTRVDQWGAKVGETTTVKKQLEKMIGDYWSTRVGTRDGKPTDSSYSSVSRAEYVMMTVCSEKFSDDMKALSLNVCGHLKDGLRNQIGAHMDNLLSDLFRVKSLQDQGKVQKPY